MEIRETTDQPAVARREIKTPRDIRIGLAELDVPVGRFAELAGMKLANLSAILHNRYRMTQIARIRIERAFEQLDAEEAARVAAGEHAEEIPRSDRFPRIRKL